jgi:glycerophosphoryl diester phosphodiesterase
VSKDAHAFLLVFDAVNKTIQVKGFRMDQALEADKDYLDAEKYYAANPDVQVVLVSVDSLTALHSAYPTITRTQLYS